MTTPGDKIPVINEGAAKRLKSFLDSITNSGNSEIIAIIKMIGDNSFDKKTVSSFFAYHNKKDHESLGKLIATGLEQKAFTEQQLIEFFKKLHYNSNINYSKNILLKTLAEATYFKKQKNNSLIIDLVSIFLNDYAQSEENDAEREEILRGLSHLRISRSTSNEIIVNAYKKIQNKEVQEKILHDICAINDDNLLLNLKIANPVAFNTFYSSLKSNEQQNIDKMLKESDNILIDLLKDEDYKTASDVFICHPLSPSRLLRFLNRGQANEAQFKEFFNTLLHNENTNIQIIFTAMRACLDSQEFMNQNPSLALTLMASYLNFALNSKQIMEACNILASKYSYNSNLLKLYTQVPENDQGLILKGFLNSFNTHKNIDLINGLRKFNSTLFESVLNELDQNTKKAIRSLLSTPATENKEHVELTVVEEELLIKFKNLLNKPDTHSGNFSELEEVITSINKYNYDRHPMLSKILLTVYIKKGIELNKVKMISEFLCSHPYITNHIVEAYGSLSNEEQTILLPHLIESCGKKYNAILIASLREINPREFHNVLSSSTEELRKRTQELLAVPKEARLGVSNIMQEFSMPFRRMTADAAKLFCAVTKKRKSYPFNPTVLEGGLREYLTILKNSEPPNNEKFILCGDHWISGEVDIPNERSPKILFLDSLGAREPKTHAIIDATCFNLFRGQRKVVTSGKLKIEFYDKLKIYVSQEKRQKSGLGCTLFTLRDIQDLYTIDNQPQRNLEPKYGGKLWNFISENVVQGIYGIKKGNARACLLPLRFMRIDQDSFRLVSETLSNRSTAEQSLPITKKLGETALDSAKKHFKRHEGKERNERLVYKLEEMGKDIFQYLQNNRFDFSKVLNEMEEFSFKSFKARMEAKKSDIEVKLNSEQKSSDEKSKVETRSALHFQYDQGVKDIPTASTPAENLQSRDKSQSIRNEAVSKIFNILQNKFRVGAFGLIRLVEELGSEYQKNSIKDVDSMKGYLKQNVDPAFIEDMQNKGDFEELFQQLTIMMGVRSTTPSITRQ